jgi:hypothetical protein
MYDPVKRRERNPASTQDGSLYARAGTATDGLLACVRGRLAARAFSASFSQRRPKFRRSSATSGELASLARRAHSAAWVWQ